MSQELTITICMGSSCYSRGNRRNIEVIQKFLADEKQDADVQVVGHLCEGHCLQGPNVQIAGTIYHAVDSASVASLLQHHLKNQNSPNP